MNTKALRQKILDLAIHGKLVPQNPKDESATVLLERIRAEKAEKIKQGELKADKKDSFIFVGSDKHHYEQFADGTVKDIEDEIPFDVPEGWAWCRIKEVCTIVMGSSPDGKSVSESTNGKEFHQGKVYFTDKYLNESNSFTSEVTKIAPINSLLLCVRAPVGIVNITQREICIGRGLCCLFPNYEIDIDFWFYWMQFFKNDFETKATGTTFKAISVDTVKSQLIPIPPMEEQIKIVKTIDNLFEKIDSLNKNTLDLQTAIKQAKSKILDLAIHGKLVPQDPNDEPAEELLKRIATSDNRPYKKFEDEVPFDLPDTWEWCNLDDIYNHTTGKALKKSNSTGTLHKYITTSNLYWNSFDFTEVRSMYFTDEELEKCTIKKGDLILCNGGDVGRAAIWNYDYDICYQNHVSRLRPKSVDINNYFYLYLLMLYKESGLLAGKGIGITSLSASDLLTTTLPLPPLAEQQRIVTKIEELFAQLDSISEQLA